MLKSMSARSAALGVCAAAMAGAAPALAHHSFAMFDHVHRLTVAGTVSKFDWTNPHVYIELTVPDAKGGAAHYTIECASPNVLTRVGWKFNTIKVGDKISTLINPLKNGQPGGMLETLTTPDGQTLSDSNPPGGAFER
ncbi:MAG TPA: DUF6152 family protein [Caulobacteraceae bacterium]